MLKKLLSALLCALFLLPSALAVDGMDVSVFQGDINFNAARADGIECVYIRSSYGQSGVDETFRQNYSRASAAGLSFGFYHYLEARTPAAARLEAEHFAALLRPLTYDCRPALDFENYRSLDEAQATAVALAFLQRTEELLGERPMIYADTYTASTRLEDALAAYPYWAAEWDVETPDLAGTPWTDWTGWQYTDRGLVSGVNGYVDRDRFTDGVFLAEEEAAFRYTVRPGDTLWALAIRYGTTVDALVRLNHIQNPDLIYVGQVLRIPGQAPEYETYTVRPGDTLWGLAIRYGTTVAELVELNHIQNPDLIYVNQVLRIPVR